jgi:hypothetical protein
METNYVSVFVAAIAGWLLGVAWYGVLGKQWMTALGWDDKWTASNTRGGNDHIVHCASYYGVSARRHHGAYGSGERSNWRHFRCTGVAGAGHRPGFDPGFSHNERY